MKSTPTLISIQIGRPQSYSDEQGTWETAFFKETVAGSIQLSPLGLVGDAVANTRQHGGEDRAVLAYSADHYPRWQAELGRELPFGGFAENLTIQGLEEETVCIGDKYRIGEVVLQVSKPRSPCWKIPRRWGIPDLLERVLAADRYGWYYRVMTAGSLAAGLEVELVERPNPEWTIQRAFQVYKNRADRKTEVAQLVKCEALAQEWREALV